MNMNWDWLISASIIIGLILIIIARVTGQTIVELLRDIRDFLRESKEDAIERGQELVYYE